MAKCAFHISDQVDDAGELADSVRHVCEDHYYAWRDGDRSGPAHVDKSDCKRVCETCREELAAARAAKEG